MTRSQHPYMQETPHQHAAASERLAPLATQPAFVYVHRWRPFDFVMWDNRQTMHRGRRYDLNEPRELRRTTCDQVPREAARNAGSELPGEGRQRASAPCTPLETREANAPAQRPSFPGQTRACAVTKR